MIRVKTVRIFLTKFYHQKSASFILFILLIQNETCMFVHCQKLYISVGMEICFQEQKLDLFITLATHLRTFQSLNTLVLHG
jgi:hypothetical protein